MSENLQTRNMTDQTAHNISISGPHIPLQEAILTEKALNFIALIEAKFGQQRQALLDERATLQKKLDKDPTLSFPIETLQIRSDDDWTVKPAPKDLQDRRVEITGPVERKMIINALNSGANAFMADFEDSNTPSWQNQINGQLNLKDAVLGTIEFQNDKGKQYSLNKDHAVLIVRPRGLHMEERHLTIEGEPMSAAFFDFGLYLFHNTQTLLDNGSGPYFYLPKLETYLEARLWSDVLCFAEDTLGIDKGSIRVTVLIETITAAFQMDEILYELKDHIVGLNCGRWDYIFSFIKRFSKHKSFVLPDRDDVGMTRHFLNSYSQLLIKTCHRRGAHAMGGMAAQIPIKNDDKANQVALDKFIADKKREAANGHDGTWVAHPGLVVKAREIFDHAMPSPHQLDNKRDDVIISPQDLLKVPSGDITEKGLRKNINIGLLYLQAWLSGNGCVPIYNLMEDAATAEISRTQLWQWRHHNVSLIDGRIIDNSLMDSFIEDEAKALIEQHGQDTYLSDAIDLFRELVMSDCLEEFLTSKAYDLIISYENPD